MRGASKDARDQHRGLLYAFFITPFVCALGGACFLVASFYLVKDRTTMSVLVSGESEENRTLIRNSLDNDDSDDDQVAVNYVIDDADDDSGIGAAPAVGSVQQRPEQRVVAQESTQPDQFPVLVSPPV